MQYLKADTSVKVVIGPVVAVGDGFTPVTTLALTTADEAEIMKHDAAAVTSIAGNTFAAITGADGYYNLTLAAAQLDTEGMLTVLINDDSLCLPVRHDYMVVNANVFDSLFAAASTDFLQVDAVQLAGTTQDATDLADFAAAGYDPATNKVQGVVLVDTTTANTDMRGTDGAALASVCTEARLSELDAGTAGKAANQIDVIQSDTTTDIPALLANIQADTDDIQARLPAALVGGRMDADVGAISTSTAAADALELSTEAIVVGTAQTGTLTTTAMTTDLTVSAASQYNGRLIIFRSDTTTAALRNQATDITSTTVANGELGFSALTTAPVNGDTFIIV